MKESAAVFFLVVLALVASPLLLIWALRTLFPAAGAEYTVESWVAALVLILFFTAKNVNRKA